MIETSSDYTFSRKEQKAILKVMLEEAEKINTVESSVVAKQQPITLEELTKIASIPLETNGLSYLEKKKNLIYEAQTLIIPFLGGIGDVVYQVQAVKALLDTFPEKKCIIISNSPLEDLLTSFSKKYPNCTIIPRLDRDFILEQTSDPKDKAVIISLYLHAQNPNRIANPLSDSFVKDKNISYGGDFFVENFLTNKNLPKNLAVSNAIKNLPTKKTPSDSGLENGSPNYFSTMSVLSNFLGIDARVAAKAVYENPFDKELLCSKDEVKYDVVIVYDAGSAAHADISKVLEAPLLVASINGLLKKGIDQTKIALAVGLDNPLIAEYVKNIFPKISLIKGSFKEVTTECLKSKVVALADTGFGHVLNQYCREIITSENPDQDSIHVPKLISLFGMAADFDAQTFVLDSADTIITNKTAAEIPYQNLVNLIVEKLPTINPKKNSIALRLLRLKENIFGK